jgi:myo-inositol 2-dehydrogenase/D-chiro-inositol 1-dehydrogenase
MTIRVGVIGVGVMGADHARTLSSLVAGAIVTAVADVDADRAERVAREIKATTFNVAEDLISAECVDAVVVASHDSTHLGFVLATLAAGKPVLCEKPLALTVSDCATIVEAETACVGQSGRQLVAVGFSRRFDPAHIAMRDAVQGGAIGRPLIAHAIHRNVAAYPGGNSESTIIGSAIHELDALPWILGSPVLEVSWHAPASTSLLPERQDPQLILLRTANGTLNTIEVFVNATYGYDVRLEIAGETGTLSIADSSLLVRNANLGRSLDYPEDWRPRFAQAYRAELEAWVDSLSKGIVSRSMATATDGLRAIAVADAIIESMHTGGGTVSVAQFDSPNHFGSK